MSEDKPQNDSLLPLTDENQRLANLYLLQKVRSYSPKGMEGLFTALDSSMKKEGDDDIFTYIGMRKAVNRDIKDLLKYAGSPEGLRRWLKTRKDTQKLQIRITKNQFLLNNILRLLGLRFEDLFDEENLPGKADETIDANAFSISDGDSRENNKLLREINAKLDTIILKQKGDRPRKTYFQRFTDLYSYFFLSKIYYLRHVTSLKIPGFHFINKTRKQNGILKKYIPAIFILSIFLYKIFTKYQTFRSCFLIYRIPLITALAWGV